MNELAAGMNWIAWVAGAVAFELTDAIKKHLLPPYRETGAERIAVSLNYFWSRLIAWIINLVRTFVKTLLVPLWMDGGENVSPWILFV